MKFYLIKIESIAQDTKFTEAMEKIFPNINDEGRWREVSQRDATSDWENMDDDD
jgi:hypothetical protein